MDPHTRNPVNGPSVIDVHYAFHVAHPSFSLEIVHLRVSKILANCGMTFGIDASPI